MIPTEEIIDIFLLKQLKPLVIIEKYIMKEGKECEAKGRARRKKMSVNVY
jgi:hypothetical protein